MEGNVSFQDPYQFYSKRVMKEDAGGKESAKVHSYKPEEKKKVSFWRETKKIKLFPLIGKKGTVGRHIESDRTKLTEDTKADSIDQEVSHGYLPAQLSVQDLVPGKQNGGKDQPTKEEVVIVTAHDSSVLGERDIQIGLAAEKNPYGVWNRKFFSFLLFPGCMFFFYGFCMPATIFMKRSDIAYADQDYKTAMKNATIATGLYIAGFIVGACFYLGIIISAIYYSFGPEL